MSILNVDKVPLDLPFESLDPFTTKVINRTGFSVDVVKQLVLTKVVHLKWRQRTVFLYLHPTDMAMLVSVGKFWLEPLVLILEESKESWQSVLDVPNPICTVE